MDNMNKTILQAMQETKPKMDDFSEEKANALQLIIHSFKGTFKLTFFAVLTLQLICFGFALYFGYAMLYEPDLAMKINWLAGTVLAVIAFAIARLFLFMELHRLSVLREVKRVELQLSVIAQALVQDDSNVSSPLEE